MNGHIVLIYRSMIGWMDEGRGAIERIFLISFVSKSYSTGSDNLNKSLKIFC